MYGKIEYLYSKGIAETLYFKTKESFIKEIHESREIGRPINPQVIEKENERG